MHLTLYYMYACTYIHIFICYYIILSYSLVQFRSYLSQNDFIPRLSASTLTLFHSLSLFLFLIFFSLSSLLAVLTLSSNSNITYFYIGRVHAHIFDVIRKYSEDPLQNTFLFQLLAHEKNRHFQLNEKMPPLNFTRIRGQ